MTTRPFRPGPHGPALLALAIAVLPAAAQERRPAAPGATTVEYAFEVGGRKYAGRGAGECKSAPRASLYDLQAALYSASIREGDRSLQLTVWQPKDGAAAMTRLRVADGRKRFEVDTVKAGPDKGKATRGAARTTLARTEAGGTFAIEGASADGEKFSGYVRCTRFGEMQAEGG